MSYRFSSVIAAIRDASLEYDQPAPICPNARLSGCPILNEQNSDPKNCDRGNRQRCDQKLIVWSKRGGMLHLYFYFKASVEDRDGLIDEGDAQLGKLFKENFIQKESLRTV